MSKYIPGNQKHLCLEDRIYIEDKLNEGASFKDIAKYLCKDPTTISKEVKNHRLSDWYHKGAFLNAKNFFVLFFYYNIRLDMTKRYRRTMCINIGEITQSAVADLFGAE